MLQVTENKYHAVKWAALFSLASCHKHFVVFYVFDLTGDLGL